VRRKQIRSLFDFRQPRLLVIQLFEMPVAQPLNRF